MFVVPWLVKPKKKVEVEFVDSEYDFPGMVSVLPTCPPTCPPACLPASVVVIESVIVCLLALCFS